MRTLKPLRQYEPYRDLHRFIEAGGQLTLDLLPARLPRPRAGAGGRTALPLTHVRSVLNAVLEVRTGRRSLSQVQGMVGAQLYTQLALWPPLKDVRLTLKSLRGCAVPPSSYEASATAVTATRTYALMARFDLLDGGWRCTLFDLIAPGQRPR
jgi:hypothetical protein